MSRIAARFKALAAQGRGALIPYLEAYDPDRETSLELFRAMPAAGADLIEVGMPFSDPSADGPVIQAAALRGSRPVPRWLACWIWWPNSVRGMMKPR